MNNINDRDSLIYKNGLKRTQNINEKLEKSRISDLTTGLKLGGPKEDILSHLRKGPAKNLVCAFFKSDIKCDCCGIEKSNTIQLDRAHCNEDGCDRASLLKEAVDIYYKDENTLIESKAILRSFLRLHIGKPLFILCKKCHREYDKGN